MAAQTIDANIGTEGGTQEVSQIKVIRDKYGYFYLAWMDYDGSYNRVWLVKSSNILGTSWGIPVGLAGNSASFIFNQGNYSQLRPSLAIDNANDRLHVVWSDRSTSAWTVAYSCCVDLDNLDDSNSWKKADLSTQGFDQPNSGPGTTQMGYYPSIVLTFDGKPAFITTGYNASNVFTGYYNRYNGGWLGSAVAVFINATGVFNVGIAIDSTDKLHAVYRSIDVFYKSCAFADADTASNWKKRDGTAGEDTVINPNNAIPTGEVKLAIDSNDRAWIVAGEGTDLDIHYNYSTGATTWNNATGTALDTTGNLKEPSIGFGSDSNIYIAYVDNSNNDVVYKASTVAGTPSFGSKTVIYNASATQYYPLLEMRGELVDYLGVLWTRLNGAQYDLMFDLLSITTAPVQSGIDPATGANNGNVPVTITGTDFRYGAAVKLTKLGESDINATSIVVSSDTELTCSFDLTGTVTGTWDLVVTNPAGGTCNTPVTFEITEYVPPAGGEASGFSINSGIGDY